MQADNVDQLMEIVRALKRGEEPTQESIDAYAAEKAKEEQQEESVSARGKSSAKTTEPRRTAKTEKPGQLQKRMADLLAGVSEKRKTAAQKARGARETESDHLAEGKNHRQEGSQAGERETLRQERIREPEKVRKPARVHEDSEDVRESERARQDVESTRKSGRDRQETESTRKSGRDRQETESTRKSERDRQDAERTRKPERVRRDPEDTRKPEEVRQVRRPGRQSLADQLAELLHDGKERVQEILEDLQDKGIARRELFMLGVVVLFAVLILIVAVRSIGGFISTRQKSRNVTADKGLAVTVEEEPKSWCRSYPVRLKFSSSSGTITQIRVDGKQYTPDEEGIVTLEAEDWQLAADVQTDQGELSAQIEIPYLDPDAPTVHASREGVAITLTAADERSGQADIYWAEVSTAFLPLPKYQKYSGPITYKEGVTYYFYAIDAAGNRSTPVATTMEAASRIVTAEETLALFPGETRALAIAEEPAGALLNGLKFESMNPELLSVDENGKVTALAEGTGVVKISAEGVADVQVQAVVADARTVTISAIGDCTLGTDPSFDPSTSFNAFDIVNGHAYFFQKVLPVLQEDDVTFANLEGTFTTATQREEKQFTFKGDPSYTQILSDGSVEVVTLANNHSGDYGAQGLADTETALEAAGIPYCSGDTIVMQDVNGIRTAFIGIFVRGDGSGQLGQTQDTIAEAKAQGAQLVIVAYHWGSEKATSPDELQQTLAHLAIDCGADLVVGHHPHVLQGIEKYKGKYIAYSLGNFCFGGNSNPSDKDTMIFRQTFTMTADGLAAKDEVTVIPCSISSDQSYNNYQPMPVTGDAAASIIEKLNGYSAGYGVSIASDGTVTADEA